MSNKLITVQLPDEGTDKHVVVLNPLHLTRKEMREIQPREGESELDYSGRFLKSVVVSGNLTAKDGRLLQYPLSDDDLDEMTNYHAAMINKAFEQATKEATEKN